MEVLRWVLEYPIVSYIVMAILSGFVAALITKDAPEGVSDGDRIGLVFSATLLWPIFLPIVVAVGAVGATWNFTTSRTPEEQHKRRLAKLKNDWEYEQEQIRITSEREAAYARIAREIEGKQ